MIRLVCIVISEDATSEPLPFILNILSAPKEIWFYQQLFKRWKLNIFYIHNMYIQTFEAFYHFNFLELLPIAKITKYIKTHAKYIPKYLNFSV